MSEAFFEIPIGDTSLELNRENTSIFRHLGNAAIYDHVFIVTEDNEGGYIWRTHSQFDEISEAADEALCVTHSNIYPPSDCDVENYVRHHASELDDEVTVPEGWE